MKIALYLGFQKDVISCVYVNKQLYILPKRGGVAESQEPF